MAINHRLIVCRWGVFTFEFEPWSGWIRNVRVDRQEVVRAIYAVARDENWGTPPQTILNVSDEADRLSWESECVDPRTPFKLTGSAKLVTEKELKIEVEITPTVSFSTNRTGVCLLHPAELALSYVEIETPEGAVTDSQFPYNISPHQPFKEVRRLSHAIDDGWLDIHFAGEVFETEDQRNWSDASYKTYCRPHDWPRPYSVAAGEPIRHSITLVADLDDPEVVSFSLDSVGCFPTPRLGLLNRTDLPAPFRFSVTAASGLSNPWDVPGLGVKDTCTAMNFTSNSKGALVYPSNFTELNRAEINPTPPKDLGFGIDAQVHAFDERSILETTVMHEVIGQSAFDDFEPKSLHAIPVIFGPSSDSRWLEPVARAWWLSTLIHAGRGGLRSLTFDFPDSVFEDPEWQELFDAVEPSARNEWRPIETSDPYQLAGFQDEVTGRIMLVNLREIEITVKPDRMLRSFEWEELDGMPLNNFGKLSPFQIVIGDVEE